MIFFKNRLILGWVSYLIRKIIKLIYKLLKFLNLQLTLLVSILCIVLQLTGAFDAEPILKTVFLVMLAITVVYAIVMTVRRLLFPNRKPKRYYGKVQVMEKTENDTKPNEETVSREPEKEEVEEYGIPEEKAVESKPIESPVNLSPKMYAVKGHAGFYMAEYSDRVELYKQTSNGLIKIRTDYKR